MSTYQKPQPSLRVPIVFHIAAWLVVFSIVSMFGFQVYVAVKARQLRLEVEESMRRDAIVQDRLDEEFKAEMRADRIKMQKRHEELSKSMNRK